MSEFIVRKVQTLRRLNSTNTKVRVQVWEISAPPTVSRTVNATYILDFGVQNALFSLGKNVFNAGFFSFFDALEIHGKFKGKQLRSRLDEALNTYQPTDNSDGTHWLCDIYVDSEGEVYAT